MTMKKQIIYMVCATALLSSCHIYKAYERPDSIDATGISLRGYDQYGKPSLEGSFS